MPEIVIYISALLASGLTLISGFGLGTLMLPVFALFFPVEVAVGITAIVHVLNNIFKMGLIYKNVNWKVVLLFGLPGMVGAGLGAFYLLSFKTDAIWFQNEWITVKPLYAIIGFLMILFAVVELKPNIKSFKFSKKYLLPGGFVSGFFGGLSGHQGALRSMFLVRANLEKTTYIATGVAIALMVDATRIPIYWSKYNVHFIQDNLRVLALSTLFAFLGAFLGKKMIKKISYRGVHLTVGVLLIFMGVSMIVGLI